MMYPTQFAYRKSKDISDVLLNLDKLIYSIKPYRDNKLLLSLDFSSAFNSLDHNFICDVLKLLNFLFFITVIRNYLKDNLSCRHCAWKKIFIFENSQLSWLHILKVLCPAFPMIYITKNSVERFLRKSAKRFFSKSSFWDTL